jgi:hypothetical protein
MLVGLAILPGAVAGFAQTSGTRVRDTNVNSWWVYQGDHKFERTDFGTFVQVQVRRADAGATWQQLQFLQGATYQLSPRIQVSAGYAWTRTARYGDRPAVRPLVEHRTYQQVLIKHSARRLALDHRFRLEQRFLETTAAGVDFFRYQNRVRYQLRVSMPVSRGEQWYAYGGSEVMLHFGPNHGPDVLDQTRPFAGLGYKLTKHNKVETGYMLQHLLQRNGQTTEFNHTLRLQWSSTLGLFGGEE